jgi:4'-phosphopantetheinyl transferase
MHKVLTMQTIQGIWPLADWRLNPADIHVWTISLDITASCLSGFERILSTSELARARSFRFDLHRNRFIAGRGSMRTLLSRYLKTEPAHVNFGEGPHGKPYLSGAFAESGLNFNLAHSENLGLFAVTRAGSIGVDIERIRPLTDSEQIADCFFSARESAEFHGLAVGQKLDAFFNLWTRKEAWLKATGEGIGQALKDVEVSFLPGEAAQFLSLPASPQSQAAWILQSLEPAPGFAAAIALRALVTPIYCCCFGEESASKMLAESVDI